jgi:hypothetical protein
VLLILSQFINKNLGRLLLKYVVLDKHAKLVELDIYHIDLEDFIASELEQAAARSSC